ncbi:MAG: MltA domain-containing protein [Desulfovibrio sp.]|jgi:membrane-bound lytic murein transglycosylase A|nr:MltA domain-containing protein [Desulfovibrio sp.]
MHERTPTLHAPRQEQFPKNNDPADALPDLKGQNRKNTERNGPAKFSALSVLFLFCFFFFACAKKTPDKVIPPPGPLVTFESPDFFVSNLAPDNQNLKSWMDIAPTLRKSLLYVKGKAGDAVAVQRPGLTLTYGDLARTLVRLQDLLPLLDAEPQLFLQHFRWIELNGGINYSGYYEPTVRASRTRATGYPQPVYYCPPELKNRRHRRGFYNRRTIEEKQVLANRGLELAWVADPVDSFFLEIQGSGRLFFEDGTQIHVNYDCQNGHKYKSSGKIMREKGLLTRGDIYEQREWFKKNPARVREILNDNPSYVFFRLGDRGPIGAMGHEVDAWLSIATSRNHIPLGAVVAYGVNVPDRQQDRVPLRGIGFAQDVGGAIKGSRIDIFCGSDERAGYVASHLDAKGPAWVLTAK